MNFNHKMASKECINPTLWRKERERERDVGKRGVWDSETGPLRHIRLLDVEAHGRGAELSERANS